MIKAGIFSFVFLCAGFQVASASDSTNPALQTVHIPKLVKNEYGSFHDLDLIQLRDRNLVIVPAAKSGEILFINTDTLKVTRRIGLKTAPAHMETNREAERLTVAGNAKTFTVSRRRIFGIPFGFKTREVKVGAPIVAAESIDKRYSAFCLGNDATLGAQEKIIVYDHKESKVVSSTQSFDCTMMAFDKKAATLYTGSKGISPLTLFAFKYDPKSQQLTKSNEIWNFGNTGNPSGILISGRSLVVASGTGNYREADCTDANPCGYDLVKFNLDNLADPAAPLFRIGAYPSIAAFSQDGSRFAASNGDEIKIFETATEQQIASFRVRDITGQCRPEPAYSDVVSITFSGASNKLVGIVACGDFNKGDEDILFRLNLK